VATIATLPKTLTTATTTGPVLLLIGEALRDADITQAVEMVKESVS
jgi:hypothetical protein